MALYQDGDKPGTRGKEMSKTKGFLPSYFEQEYMLHRMAGAMARSFGDREGYRRATRLAWKARRNLRMCEAVEEAVEGGAA